MPTQPRANASLHAGKRRVTTIFSKCPLPGSVKTRLCPPLSPEQAAQLAEAMLVDTYERCHRAGLLTELCVTPEESLPWFRERFPEARVGAQIGAGLGERMARHFAGESEYTSRVILGSDAPHLATRLVLAAHEALEQGVDLVLGPDQGGGYYLVGLEGSHPELFTSVEMSTVSMFEETVNKARERGLSVSVLDSGYDIDRVEDLKRLAAELRAGRLGAPGDPDYPLHTARSIERMEAHEDA